MENNNKKIKLSGYFEEFNFEESNENRIKLLMEVILVHNLKEKNFPSPSIHFKKLKFFFYAV
jgi:hypothetical protein